MERRKKQANHDVREIKIAREAGRAVVAKNTAGSEFGGRNQRLQLSQWHIKTQFTKTGLQQTI